MVLKASLAATAMTCAKRKPRLTKVGASGIAFSFCALQEYRHRRFESGGVGGLPRRPRPTALPCPPSPVLLDVHPSTPNANRLGPCLTDAPLTPCYAMVPRPAPGLPR